MKISMSKDRMRTTKIPQWYQCQVLSWNRGNEEVWRIVILEDSKQDKNLSDQEVRLLKDTVFCTAGCKSISSLILLDLAFTFSLRVTKITIFIVGKVTRFHMRKIWIRNLVSDMLSEKSRSCNKEDSYFWDKKSEGNLGLKGKICCILDIHDELSLNMMKKKLV